MLETIRIGPWELEVDKHSTEMAYGKIAAGCAEACICCHCKNFIRAREQVFTEEVKSLLKKLGIDYTKETEVYHLYRIEPSIHSYGGWFHFIGNIKSRATETGEREVPVTDMA